jgi:hypothetical protein
LICKMQFARPLRRFESAKWVRHVASGEYFKYLGAARRTDTLELYAVYEQDSVSYSQISKSDETVWITPAKEFDETFDVNSNL